jgi:hypothetical protein
MNKLRARMNSGCALLLVSGGALSLAFRPIDSAIHWLAQGAAGFKTDPVGLRVIEAVALAVLGPLMLGALAYVFSNGLGRAFARLASTWLAGLRFGFVCLLLALPLLVISWLLDPADIKAVAPGSAGVWLEALSIPALFVFAIFWSLLLIRHLPAGVLRGTLFERVDLETYRISSRSS